MPSPSEPSLSLEILLTNKDNALDSSGSGRGGRGAALVDVCVLTK